MTTKTRFLVALLVGAVASVVPVPMALSAPATRLQVLGRPGAAGGQQVAFPASHVAVRWHGDDAARVQVRWQAAGAWGPWTDAPVAHDLDDPAGGLVYSAVVRAPGAERVETRVVSGAADAVVAAAIDAEHGPRRLVAAPALPKASAAATSPGPAEPPVVTRAQWGADESLRKPTPPTFAPVTKLVVHHSATANDDPDPAATVRAIYAYHTQVRGWDDIGYNFLVDGRGRLYEGRWAREYAAGETPTGADLAGNGVVGAHADGVNTGSAGIALLGDFTSVNPPAAAVATLESWLGWEAGRNAIDPLGSVPYTGVDGTTRVFPNISGHRDTRATDCPGDRLYAMLPTIRQAVASGGDAPRIARGYWMAAGDGTVRAFGSAPFAGDARALALNRPLRALVPTPSERGYWLLGGDGGIFAYGDAAFHGSTGALRLNKPVVAMAPTPTGRGYWLAASDGGIFAFGDAAFYGSTGAMRLNKPVVGMAATPTGRGYWLVASDGGIFAFGDARFAGSTGNLSLNSPIVAMEPAGTGGYWLVARDGGVFSFAARYHGSVPGLNLPSYAGSAALRGTPGDTGYYVLGVDGGVFAFGAAPFFGAHPGLGGPAAAVDLAVYDAPMPLG